MTHALTAIRILSSIGSIWAYVVFERKSRRYDERRSMQQRLEDVIRGGR